MTSPDPSEIQIPAAWRPTDGRFGSGPSKIRAEAVAALADAGPTFLGTSHRQPGVRTVVGRIRSGLCELFSLPDGWEVVLGNGGSTLFWDAATFGLIERRSEHLVFGEFSSKFARAATSAPHLDAPLVVESAPGTHPAVVLEDGIDTYAFTHNETSTGVAMALQRPSPAGLVVVDATSAAGGLPWAPSEVDVYYFAPQKCFASDGGLWVALCSPRAIERIGLIASRARWCPASLDLSIALENSRLNQTYNTPALATLFLLDNQISWMNENGGLAWCVDRCQTSATTVYQWATAHPHATPFVTEPAQRSAVVATIDLDGVDADKVCRALRANGIVDTESYRKLGRNQIRIAMFPAIEPRDVEALTRCLDYVIEALL